MRKNSKINPEKAEEKIEQEKCKDDAIKQYHSIICLRQKYEVLVQLMYFLQDMEVGGTFYMDDYLKKKRCDILSDFDAYSGIMKDLF